MYIYWFERHNVDYLGIKDRFNNLESNHFDGIMLAYGISINDQFTRISRDLDKNNKFKYIVAIRPYAISPQYLSMICNSISEISADRIEINFITGWISEEEKKYGGILGDINDSSSNIDRSNYLLKYAEIFRQLKTNTPKFFISVTNDEVFQACVKRRFNMIIPYIWYKAGRFNLSNQNYIISLAPIIRESEDDLPSNQDADLFTKKEFFNFLIDCKNKNVYGILLQESSKNSEYSLISSLIKEFKESHEFI